MKLLNLFLLAIVVSAKPEMEARLLAKSPKSTKVPKAGKATKSPKVHRGL